MQNDPLQKIADLIKSSWTKIFDQKQIRLELEKELNAADTTIDQGIEKPQFKIQNLTVSWVNFGQDNINTLFEFETQTTKGTAVISIVIGDELNQHKQPYISSCLHNKKTN